MRKTGITSSAAAIITAGIIVAGLSMYAIYLALQPPTQTKTTTPIVTSTTSTVSTTTASGVQYVLNTAQFKVPPFAFQTVQAPNEDRYLSVNGTLQSDSQFSILWHNCKVYNINLSLWAQAGGYSRLVIGNVSVAASPSVFGNSTVSAFVNSTLKAGEHADVHLRFGTCTETKTFCVDGHLEVEVEIKTFIDHLETSFQFHFEITDRTRFCAHDGNGQLLALALYNLCAQHPDAPGCKPELHHTQIDWRLPDDTPQPDDPSVPIAVTWRLTSAGVVTTIMNGAKSSVNIAYAVFRQGQNIILVSSSFNLPPGNSQSILFAYPQQLFTGLIVPYDG